MHRKETKRLTQNLKEVMEKHKIQFFSKSVQNWCSELTWKLNEANSSKIWIESKQIKINDVFD